MVEEINALEDIRTWTIEDFAPKKKPMSCKMDVQSELQILRNN